MSQKSAQAASAAQQEPSMEEILASIRRIISDDETPNAAPPAEQKIQHAPKATPSKQPPKKEEVKQNMAPKEKVVEAPKKDFPSFNEDDLLELTDVVDDNEEEMLELEDAIELDEESEAEQIVQALPEPQIQVSQNQPKHAPIQNNAIFTQNDENLNHLISDKVQESSKAALSELVSVVSQVNYSLGRGERTLEDIVCDSLKPLLKQWLDDHLAMIVEKIVREEVERIVKKLERK
jgi:cell pole-organizing protein PopZ